MRVPVIAVSALFVIASAASTQVPANRTPITFRLGVRLPLRPARVVTQICDGSAVAHAEQRHTLGQVLTYGGLGADLAVMFSASHGSTSLAPLLTVGTVSTVAGFYMLYHSSLGNDFWDNSLARAKIGETHAPEVRECFGKPNGTSLSGSQETWTYSTVNVGLGLPFFGGGGSMRSVSLSFKDGLLTNIRRDESGVGR